MGNTQNYDKSYSMSLDYFYLGTYWSRLKRVWTIFSPQDFWTFKAQEKRCCTWAEWSSCNTEWLWCFGDVKLGMRSAHRALPALLTWQCTDIFCLKKAISFLYCLAVIFIEVIHPKIDVWWLFTAVPLCILGCLKYRNYSSHYSE